LVGSESVTASQRILEKWRERNSLFSKSSRFRRKPMTRSLLILTRRSNQDAELGAYNDQSGEEHQLGLDAFQQRPQVYQQRASLSGLWVTNHRATLAGSYEPIG
jgi:hypothetical protein